jgi:hypothetical protein
MENLWECWLRCDGQGIVQKSGYLGLSRYLSDLPVLHCVLLVEQGVAPDRVWPLKMFRH